MRISNAFRAGVVVAGLLSLGSMPVAADVIVAGGGVGGAYGGAVDLFNNLPGTWLAQNNFRFTALDAVQVPRYGGELRSAVYRNGAGTLDFYYQFVSASGANYDSVGRLTMTNFSGFTTDVGYRTDDWDAGLGFVAGTQAPLLADRSANGGNVGFTFGQLEADKINPGEKSATLVIRTNAIDWTAGSLTVQNGATYQVAAYAPTAAVPEPGTYLMMGAGLIALATLRRRK